MTQVTINNITSGTSPFNVWVCDTCEGTCQYIDTITTTPYSFILPNTFESFETYVLKLVDINGCVYCDILSKYVQFEDEIVFRYMDGTLYEF
jgi:hypothetical protein